MTPQIEPGVSFIKKIFMRNQPLCNVAGDADEAIPIRCVYCFSQAPIASALHDPIIDFITEHLGFLIQRVGDIAQGGQLLHDGQGAFAILYAKDGF